MMRKRDEATKRMNRKIRKLGLPALVAGLLFASTGCEMHSWMDPSVVGRWQRTPVVLPILEKLDVIDELSTEPPGLTQVQPEDLIAVVQEYIVGPGDLVTVTVFQLLVPGVESVQTRRVDELGLIRLPIVGAVQVEGRTPSELETDIADTLVQKGVLRDPTVSVIVQEQRQNTFSVIGESTFSSTAIGTYTILGKEFRLLDAMSLARGVPGQIKKLYVIRPAPRAMSRGAGAPAALTPPATGTPALPATTTTQPGGTLNPADLIDGLMQNPQADVPVEKTVQTAPQAGATTDAPAYINVDGKWVRVTPGMPVPTASTTTPATPAPQATTTAPPATMPAASITPAAPVATTPVMPMSVQGPVAPTVSTPSATTPPTLPPMTMDGGLMTTTDVKDPFAVPLEPDAPKDILEAKARGQRVIEIPYDKLLEGDTRYNIIIRPGDVIRVPPPVIGNIYIGGAINRPGTYSLPGDKDLTLQQLIFAAGNLSPVAIPERVDLIRRIGKTQQATVRINLRAIFQGTAPDIFLKPNDTINIGTNFVATPLAVFRNGFRMSYGFGFVLDRNFDEAVFGPRVGN